MDNLDLDHNHNHQQDTYYHEYVRLYLANVALTSQVKDLVEQKNRLAGKLSKYQEDDGGSQFDRNCQKNKRFRRTAHEIDRFYKCTVKSCEKSYGSQGSLNQHYKLKHPEIYVTLPNVQPKQSQNDSHLNQSVQSEIQKAPKIQNNVKQVIGSKKSKNKQN